MVWLPVPWPRATTDRASSGCLKAWAFRCCSKLEVTRDGLQSNASPVNLQHLRLELCEKARNNLAYLQQRVNQRENVMHEVRDVTLAGSHKWSNTVFVLVKQRIHVVLASRNEATQQLFPSRAVA